MVTITERPSSPSGTSRRTLLANAALVAPASLLPAIAAAAAPEPDPHLAWFAEWQACLAYLDGPETRDVDDLGELPEWHRAHELEVLIGTTPARTAAGVR